jgi:hypothetical protein
MNQKECIRKRSWPILSLYPGICLEELSKTTKISVGIAGYRNLNPAPPEYEAGVSTTRLRRSVQRNWNSFIK